MEQAKSPRSPKKTLENPLLKPSSTFFSAPSLAPEQKIEALPAFPSRKSSLHATPGPPPIASLSLDMDLVSLEKEQTSIASQAQPPSLDLSTPTFTLPNASTPVSSFSGQLRRTEERWVIAFGFGQLSESSQVFEFLRSFGKIVETKTNNNWIAVLYENELVAASASARKLVQLGSNVCGVERVHPQFLQELSAKTTSVDDFLSIGAAKKKTADANYLTEEEILVGFSKKEKRLKPSTRRVSICERILAWCFGWDTKDHES